MFSRAGWVASKSIARLQVREAEFRGVVILRRFQGSSMIVVAILLPWLALLLNKHIFQAAFCLGLQLTLVGWIPAAIWAVVVINKDRRDRQYREMLRVLRGR